MSRLVLALLASVLCLAQVHSERLFAQQTDTERRDFAVLVDGKEVGQSRMTVTVQPDGTTVVAGTAQVSVNQLIFKYTFNAETTEWWKDGKVVGIKSNTNDNGKRVEVVAGVEGGKLKVRVNGQERFLPAESWVNSYWKLADPRYHNKALPIFEIDSGKDYTGQLQYLGTEQLTLMNQPQSCYHFRVSGGSSPVDLWYDRYHRLVRQEFTEFGHKTIVQLISVKR